MIRRPPAMVPALLLGAALVLSGCGKTDPRNERINVVAKITDAANARDAGALRRAADDLLDLVAKQQASGAIDAAEAKRLTAIATRLKTDADLIDQDKIDEKKQKELEEKERLAEQRRQAEERRKLAEDRRKLEEEQRKAEEERRRQSASPSPSPSPSPSDTGLLPQGNGNGNGKGKDKALAADPTQ